MELKDLKAGDKVIVSNRYYKFLKVVDKVTPSGYIKVDSEYYMPDDGYKRGGEYYNRSRIEIVTPEKLQAIEDKETIERAMYLLDRTRGVSMSAEKARQIIAILESE
jgi:hypothetical protein